LGARIVGQEGGSAQVREQRPHIMYLDAGRRVGSSDQELPSHLQLRCQVIDGGSAAPLPVGIQGLAQRLWRNVQSAGERRLAYMAQLHGLPNPVAEARPHRDHFRAINPHRRNHQPSLWHAMVPCGTLRPQMQLEYAFGGSSGWWIRDGKLDVEEHAHAQPSIQHPAAYLWPRPQSR